MIIAAVNLFLLGVLTVFARPGHSQTQMPACVGKYPFEPSLIGGVGWGSGGCSPGGQRSQTTVKIHSWGLHFMPLSYACPEEIVITYTKLNRPAMLYHRPYAKLSFFAKSHPKLVEKHRRDQSVKLPCHKVPVRKVHVWKNRAQFVSLVTRTVRGVEYIRNVDCSAPEYYGNPNRRFDWTEVKRRIALDRVPTAALTFLHSLAYSNFFCVKN